MAKVIWTDNALEELRCAADFIARDSRRYANALLDDALEAARSLRSFPRRGRLVPELLNPEMRELLVGKYRMIYQVQDDSVRVVAFLHGARQFPDEIR